MTLVTTMGSKSANSLITVAEAATYLAAGPYNVTAWTALTTAAKELRLTMAARLMKYMTWCGYPVYEEQSMPFPRRWTEDDDIEIPDDIKCAQAWLAYDIVHRGLVDSALKPPTEGSPGDDVQSLSLGGVISVSLSKRTAPASGDSGALLAYVASCSFPLYLLIAPYYSQVTYLPAVNVPDLLAAVD